MELNQNRGCSRRRIKFIINLLVREVLQYGGDQYKQIQYGGEISVNNMAEVCINNMAETSINNMAETRIYNIVETRINNMVEIRINNMAEISIN